MANDADQIVVAGTGRVLVAAVGTTAPTGVSGAYAAGWTEVGYTTEDGVTFSDSKDVEDRAAWQSLYPVRRLVTGRSSSVSFTLLEWSASTVPLAFGGGAVTEPSAGVFKYTPPDPEDIDERALSVEWTDGTKIYRLVIPRGNVSEGVETNLTRTGAAELPITFSVLGSDATAPWHMLTNDPAFDATP